MKKLTALLFAFMVACGPAFAQWGSGGFGGGGGISVAGATTGDLLYYDGAAWARLAAGTDAYQLKMVSGLPAWAAASAAQTADESTLHLTGGVFSIKSTYVGQTSITTLGTIGTGSIPLSLTTGTLPAAQLPNPSASTLGGVQSKAAVTSNFLTSISTSGVPAAAQPAFSDISGTASAAQLASTAVTPGSYTKAGFTVDAQGRLTAAASGTADVAYGGFRNQTSQTVTTNTTLTSSSAAFTKTNQSGATTDVTLPLISTVPGGAYFLSSLDTGGGASTKARGVANASDSFEDGNSSAYFAWQPFSRAGGMFINDGTYWHVIPEMRVGGLSLSSRGGSVVCTLATSGPLTLTESNAATATGQLLASTSNSVDFITGQGTSGYPLLSAGAGVAPAFGQLALGTGVSGLLGIGNGGTGASSFTQYGPIYGGGGSALGVSGVGTTGWPYVSAGGGSAPQFAVLGAAGGGTSDLWGVGTGWSTIYRSMKWQSTGSGSSTMRGVGAADMAQNIGAGGTANTDVNYSGRQGIELVTGLATANISYFTTSANNETEFRHAPVLFCSVAPYITGAFSAGRVCFGMAANPANFMVGTYANAIGITFLPGTDTYWQLHVSNGSTDTVTSLTTADVPVHITPADFAFDCSDATNVKVYQLKSNVWTLITTTSTTTPVSTTGMSPFTGIDNLGGGITQSKIGILPVELLTK